MAKGKKKSPAKEVTPEVEAPKVEESTKEQPSYVEPAGAAEAKEYLKDNEIEFNPKDGFDRLLPLVRTHRKMVEDLAAEEAEFLADPSNTPVTSKFESVKPTPFKTYDKELNKLKSRTLALAGDIGNFATRVKATGKPISRFSRAILLLKRIDRVQLGNLR